MTTGKTIALTRWTFVGKVMSLFSLNHSVLKEINPGIVIRRSNTDWPPDVKS